MPRWSKASRFHLHKRLEFNFTSWGFQLNFADDLKAETAGSTAYLHVSASNFLQLFFFLKKSSICYRQGVRLGLGSPSWFESPTSAGNRKRLKKGGTVKISTTKIIRSAQQDLIQRLRSLNSTYSAHVSVHYSAYPEEEIASGHVTHVLRTKSEKKGKSLSLESEGITDRRKLERGVPKKEGSPHHELLRGLADLIDLRFGQTLYPRQALRRDQNRTKLGSKTFRRISSDPKQLIDGRREPSWSASWGRCRCRSPRPAASWCLPHWSPGRLLWISQRSRIRTEILMNCSEVRQNRHESEGKNEIRSKDRPSKSRSTQNLLGFPNIESKQERKSTAKPKQ